MAVNSKKSNDLKQSSASRKNNNSQKATGPKKKPKSRSLRTNASSQTRKTEIPAKAKSSKNDGVSLGKIEEEPRDSFVNPLLNFDSENNDVAGSGNSVTAASEKPEARAEKIEAPRATEEADAKQLPEGVSQDQAKQVTQQIQDFTNLATHLPAILKMGEEIKDGGIQAKHAEALEAAYGPMKGLLTPENIQAFKGLDVDQVDKLLNEQNLGILKTMAPELSKGMDSDKIKQLKDGLKQAQGMLDPKKIGGQMMMMSPFVQTSHGKGALNMVAGMVDDPTQLGGADRKLSMTDIGQVTNGLLNTGPVKGLVNGRIAQGINQAVNFRKDGRRRTRLGRAVVGGLTSRPKVQQRIYNEAWGQVRSQAPGEVRKQAAPYLGNGGSPQDRNIQRRFKDEDVQKLMNIGRQVQAMRGQTSSSGHQQIDNANATVAGMTGILHKSLVGDDGAISGEELRQVSDFGTQLYNYMGLLHHGVGGTFQR